MKRLDPFVLKRRLMLAMVSGLTLTLAIAFYASLAAVGTNEVLAVAEIQILDTKTNTVNAGSATFISPDGYLLTNYHVISPAVKDKTLPIVLCLTSDARKPPLCSPVGLELRAFNEQADLALLRLKLVLPKGSTKPTDFDTFVKEKQIVLNHVKIDRAATEENINLGDSVQILGYPVAGGKSITYTGGVVSGFERMQGGEDWVPWLIKTDAKLNPGNSGGAAFNQQNDFIGVPTLVRGGEGNIGYIISLPVVDAFLNATGLSISTTSPSGTLTGATFSGTR